MAKLYVAFLLDLFQPSTQSSSIIDEVARECYQPLVDLFNSKPNAKFTVSLANSVAKLLVNQGENEIIDGFTKAVEDCKIEMIHTGAYHPIFPLIQEREVRRQIELDMEFKSNHFGLKNKSGICPPELCYDDKLLPLYKDLGFSWTVIDDCVMAINGITPPAHEILHVDGVAVFMRSTLWSNWIRDEATKHLTGREFVRRLEDEVAEQDKDSYKLIAISGETFGHHVKYYQETFLRDMLCNLAKSESVQLCLVSELLDKPSLSKVDKMQEHGKDFKYFPPCSWATQEDDYLLKNYYPHWKSPGNRIHENLWMLTNLILETSQEIDFSNNLHNELRELLDRAFYSTQYFWASIWFWKPSEIYTGIDNQMRALYQCAALTNNLSFLTEGQMIYTKLMWEILTEQDKYLSRNGIELDKWNEWKTTLSSIGIDTLQEVHKQ